MNKDKNTNEMLIILKELYQYKVLTIAILISVGSVFGYIQTISRTNTVTWTLNTIFLGLIPTGLIGILWESLIKKDFLRYVKDELALLLGRQCKPVQLINKFGIADITPNRESLEIYLRTAKHRIWILITHCLSLTALPGVRQSLKDMSSTVEIKILVLNPNSISVELRTEESSRLHGNLKRNIEETCNQVKEEFEEVKEKVKDVEIRFYDPYPRCCMFLVDSQILVSPLVIQKRGNDSVHFLVNEKNSDRKDNILFKQYEEHFNALFERAKKAVFLKIPKCKM